MLCESYFNTPRYPSLLTSCAPSLLSLYIHWYGNCCWGIFIVSRATRKELPSLWRFSYKSGLYAWHLCRGHCVVQEDELYYFYSSYVGNLLWNCIYLHTTFCVWAILGNVTPVCLCICHDFLASFLSGVHFMCSRHPQRVVSCIPIIFTMCVFSEL